MTDTHISERYEFRNIKQNEAEEAAEIERICFPPNEACSKKHMKDRVAGIADLFLVAIDKENGKMAGFLNGLATDDEILKDEFFTDASLHNPEGKNIMLLGLDVLPEYRSQGLARELVRRYLEREWGRGRKEIILWSVRFFQSGTGRPDDFPSGRVGCIQCLFIWIGGF